MLKTLKLTKQEFCSSCTQTPQYLSWHKTFRKEFTKFLTEQGCTKIEISKPNHFDASGFFTEKSGQIYYFRLEDLRWYKQNILIRTAKDYKDYTGGSNQYCTLDNFSNFSSELRRIIKAN